MLVKRNKWQKQRYIYFSGVFLFALVSVLGLSLITGNEKQSNVGTSHASAQEPTDINNDNKVDVFDLSILLGKWNTTDSLSDLNKDNTVNVFDLSMLLAKWGLVVAAPGSIAGAQLPVSYDIATLTGTKIYVSTTGNDTTGTGTESLPYKSVRKAVSSVSVNPTTILIRGGTYNLASEPNATFYADWSKAGYAINIKAYPGEIPIFEGSIASPTTSITENGVGAGGANLKSVDYRSIPEGLGAGLTLTNLPGATFSGTVPTGMAASVGFRCVTSGSTYTTPSLTPSTSNPSGCATGTPIVISAYYADQVWYNGVRLRQVLDKNKVTVNAFYVQRDGLDNTIAQQTKLYVDASLDLNKLKLSNSNVQLRITNPNVSIEGIKILNNSPGKDALISFYVSSNADNATMKNVEFIDNANVAVTIAGSSTNGVVNGTFENITAKNSGWSGLTGLYTDNLQIKNSIFSDSNLDKEYNFGPQAGGIKFSRIYKSKIIGNIFENNYGAGLWYDQQNYDAEVVGNKFIDNASSGLFYEISHKLLFANNYIKSSSDSAVRSAGSGDLKFVNNTIVGGGAGIAIYTDDRSKKYDSNADGTPDRWCSEHEYRYGGASNTAVCGGMTSDLNQLHKGEYGTTNETPGMNWMPSVTMILNNIITDQYADTTTHSNCTYDAVAVCFVAFHSAGPTTNPTDMIPGSAIVNGNIYQTNYPTKRFFHMRTTTGQTCGVDVLTLAALKTAFANTACYNKNVETNGKYSSTHEFAQADGNAQPSLNHAEAAPAPTDSSLNQYIPAGTRHYGIVQ